MRRLVHYLAFLCGLLLEVGGVSLGPPAPPLPRLPVTVPSPGPPANALPGPLYFLSDRTGAVQVWRLEADGLTARAVTAEDSGVSAFAVSRWGQVAYASRDGTLYVLAPWRRQPRVAVKLGKRAGQTLFTSVAWSPDEQRLAYVLQTPVERVPKGASADEVWNRDGLWLHREGQPDDTQLLPNIARSQFTARQRVVTAVAWSPRGNGLLVRLQGNDAAYYGLVWLEAPYTLSAVDPQPGHTPLFGQVAWMPDGRMLLRGGALGQAACSLTLVDGLSSRVRVLLDDPAAGACAAFPQPLPDGSLGFLLSSGRNGRFRLQRGRLVEGRLVYGPASDEAFEKPLAAAWAPGGQGVVLELAAPGGGAARRLVYASLAGAPGRPLLADHPHARQACWGP